VSVTAVAASWGGWVAGGGAVSVALQDTSPVAATSSAPPQKDRRTRMTIRSPPSMREVSLRAYGGYAASAAARATPRWGDSSESCISSIALLSGSWIQACQL